MAVFNAFTSKKHTYDDFKNYSYLGAIFSPVITHYLITSYKGDFQIKKNLQKGFEKTSIDVSRFKVQYCNSQDIVRALRFL